MTDIVERLRLSVTKGHEPTDEDAIEAAAEIARLRADKVILQDALNVRTDLAIQQDAEIELLRAALKPFAEVAREWDGEDMSLEIELRAYDDRPGPGISVADFREARAALKDTTP